MSDTSYTDEMRKETLRLDAAATPGPWERDFELVYALEQYGWYRGKAEYRNRFSARMSGDCSGVSGEELVANAEFFQHARTALPATQAEVDRLQAENERLVTKNTRLRDALEECAYHLYEKQDMSRVRDFALDALK